VIPVNLSSRGVFRSVTARMGSKSQPEPPAAPHCSVAQLWKAAIALNAPGQGHVATVSYEASDYYPSSAGRPYWDFKIEDAAFGAVFDDRTCLAWAPAQRK